MKISFDKLPETSRLWVYQADRALSESEIANVRSATETYIDQWQAHGKPLTAAYEFRFDRFLVIAVDENQNMATGCSIDDSVRLVKALENELNVSFLDRTKVAYQVNDEVQVDSIPNIKKKATEGILDPKTVIFNNSVQSKGQYQADWMQPIEQSWLNRFLKKSVV